MTIEYCRQTLKEPKLVVLLIGPTCAGKTMIGEEIVDSDDFCNRVIPRYLKFNTTRARRNDKERNWYTFDVVIPENVICHWHYDTAIGPMDYYFDPNNKENLKAMDDGANLFVSCAAHYSYIEPLCEYFSDKDRFGKVYIYPIFIQCTVIDLLNRFYASRCNGSENINSIKEMFRRVEADWLDYSKSNEEAALKSAVIKYGDMIIQNDNFITNYNSNNRPYEKFIKIVKEAIYNLPFVEMEDNLIAYTGKKPENTVFVSIVEDTNNLATALNLDDKPEFFITDNNSLLSAKCIWDNVSVSLNVYHLIHNHDVVIYNDHWIKGPYIDNGSNTANDLADTIINIYGPNKVIVMQRR